MGQVLQAIGHPAIGQNLLAIVQALPAISQNLQATGLLSRTLVAGKEFYLKDFVNTN